MSYLLCFICFIYYGSTNNEKDADFVIFKMIRDSFLTWAFIHIFCKNFVMKAMN